MWTTGLKYDSQKVRALLRKEKFETKHKENKGGSVSNEKV